MANSARSTSSEARRAPRATVRTSEVNLQPAAQASTGDSSQSGIKGTIKKHPYATSAVAALAVSAAYLLYKHFTASSSSTTPTSTTTSGFPLNTGSGTRRGGGAGGIGSGSGGGSGGGGSTGSTGSASSAPPATVDLSSLSGLFSGIQSELGLLGQEIAGLGSAQTPPVTKPANIGPAASGSSVQTFSGLTASQILNAPTANPGATTQYINAQATMPVSKGGSIPTYTGTPLGPGTPVITSGLQAYPTPAKSTAAAPNPSANQHINSSPISVNAAAPKAQAVSNTQAAHAQQTAKAASNPGVRTSVGHSTLTRG